MLRPVLAPPVRALRQRRAPRPDVGAPPPPTGPPGPAPAPVLTAEQRGFWDANGYLVLPGFFSPDQVAGFDTLLDRLWAERARADNPLVIDVFWPGHEVRQHFRDAPGDARDQVHKLNDLYLSVPEVRALALDERLAAILGELIDGEPCIINSLNFEYGSQQPFHFDTWYMPPVVEGKLVVSFIAFEDIDAGNGPLQYYPGSHLIPPYRFSHGLLNAIPEEVPACYRHVEAWTSERGIEPERFHCRAGDVFLWHAQLFHGGSPITEVGRTRRSLVTHYFRAQDVHPPLVRRVGPGRAWMERDHQAVPAGN
jgi:ectoine hydroxylase-related dioxygenase (phytanoyl-CoA dioxygenase family)